MKAMLLRVGIDKGVWPNRVSDGAYSPIFVDGSFEFIPKSEETRYPKTQLNSIDFSAYPTYKEVIGRTGKPLAYYLPKRLWERHPHLDPEFETFTYGDHTVKRRYLLKLDQGDLLVFYAGLTPYHTKKRAEGLYIVGYLTVEKVIDFDSLSQREIHRIKKAYPHNAHFRAGSDLRGLVLVVGNRHQSRLLDKAIPLTQPKRARDGRYYQAVSLEMQRKLGLKGSVQKSVPPRFITGESYFRNLRSILREG